MPIFEIESQIKVKMLRKFTIENYKVFQERSILDLRSTTYTELEVTNTFVNQGQRLLKSAVIYGKNASGKSNLLNGLEFMADFVIESAKDKQSNEAIETDFFRLSTASQEKDSHFEVEFILDGINYRYGFEVNRTRVNKEWLLVRPKKKEYDLFLRIGDEFQINEKRFPEGKGKTSWTRKNALFLSLVAQLNGTIAQSIIEWFSKLVFAHHFCDCSWEDDNLTEQLLQKGKDYKDRILTILQKADVDISDIELIQFKESRSNKTGKLVQAPFEHSLIQTYHKKYNAAGESEGMEVFNLFEDESDGTIRLFNLIGYILDALDTGKVVFLDEIDGRLHTLLAQAIVLLFNSKKNIHSQFIFTTHDTNLLNKDLLRRDQIYFVEKNRFGASKIYSLATFKPNGLAKVRKDADYEINYLKGRYGAIPFINEF